MAHQINVHSTFLVLCIANTIFGVLALDAVCLHLSCVFVLQIKLVMCSVSTNGERAGLAISKLTIDSLLECS